MWYNGRRQNSRGGSKEGVEGFLMLSMSYVLGIVSWGERNRENKHGLCFQSLWPMEKTDTDTCTRMQERK